MKRNRSNTKQSGGDDCIRFFQTEEHWTVVLKPPGETALERRERKLRLLKTNESQPVIQFERFSYFNGLLRTTCYCSRFSEKLIKAPTGTRETIDTHEMQVALTQFFLLLQKEQFEAEVNTMRISGHFSANHPLASLISRPISHPDLGNVGLLRVGDRFLNSELPKTVKLPELLKGNHHVVTSW